MNYYYTIKVAYLAERLRLHHLVSRGRMGHCGRDGGVGTRRWVCTGLCSAASGLNSWPPFPAGKHFWELWEHYFSYWLTFIGVCGLEVAEMGILLPGLHIHGGVLLVVVQNWLEACWKKHCLTTLLSTGASPLALLSKGSSSNGIPNAVESFTVNLYLMT